MMCVCLRAERRQRTPAETNGFWRHFLHTFCCCWQKVCRRRQKTLCEKETRRRHKKEKATGNISRRRHVPYEKGSAGRKAPVGDTTQNTPLHRRCSPRKKERAMARSFLLIIFLLQLLFSRFGCSPVSTATPRFPQGRGCCWVMQWILPPPKATSRVCTPTTSRSGNISCTCRTARASFSSPYWGRITPPLTMRKFI